MRWRRHHIEIKSSILSVLCNGSIEKGIENIAAVRRELEQYLSQNRAFADTHAPLPMDPAAPEGVRLMLDAAGRMGVGPMAAVAGMIAHTCLEGVLAQGNREAVVDNGGDIVMDIEEPVTVGLYAGTNFSPHLGFVIEPREGPFAICTSAGTVGHSFSYGSADAAVVFSEHVVLADAAATALGNRIRHADDLHRCFDIFNGVQEIEGAVAVIHGRIGLWGTVPQLITTPYNPELITVGRSHDDEWPAQHI